MTKVRNRLLLGGTAGAVLCAWGVFRNHDQFFVSYLFAYQFWFGIAAGCLGLVMLHALTGGAWGDVIHPLLEAGMMTLPWFALFFIPLLWGLPALYPWARPEEVLRDTVLQHKQIYLNVPFFELRALGYFGLWSWMAWRLHRWTRQSAEGDADSTQQMNRHSGPGLVLYFLSLTFAALDWMMSLEPHWSSTMYEVMIIVGYALAAFAFAICVLAWLRPPRPLVETWAQKPMWDLGNLVLAFVMFWAYLSFSQYLVIWSANLPEEITWYQRRQTGGWFWVAMTLIGFQFFLPFLALLGRRNKQRLERLAAIAALLLAVHLVELFWLVQPAFYPQGFHAHWMDGAVPVTLGALWLAVFLTQLKKLPSPIGVYRAEAQA